MIFKNINIKIVLTMLASLIYTLTNINKNLAKLGKYIKIRLKYTRKMIRIAKVKKLTDYFI